jgi:hypothetical protein
MGWGFAEAPASVETEDMSSHRVEEWAEFLKTAKPIAG